MKPKKLFGPENLRSVLTALLIIILLLGSGLFYLGLNMVREYAIAVNQGIADAEASAQQIQGLQVLKGQLAQSNSLIEKANQLFTTPAGYQSQTLTDINNYATAAGLTIASTTFNDPTGTGVYSATVTFKDPVSYSKLLAFLHNIEGNLPKFQVSSVSLGYKAGGNADSVSVASINIDISVR
jgi:hypothetical protein